MNAGPTLPGSPAPGGALREKGEIALPCPARKGAVSVEEALSSRRSFRVFGPEALSAAQLSQLLWAAYGISGAEGGVPLHTAPSAGALYPIDLYLVAGSEGVEGLAAGVYEYLAEAHRLRRVAAGEVRPAVAAASLEQEWMAQAPAIVVISGEEARSARKYGSRGGTYTLMESGHIAQNVFLQAEALGLRAGIVGAFREEPLLRALGIPPSHRPLLLLPVGYGR